MKLEVGMYVRTKNNGICKLYREFFEDSVDVGIGIFPEIDGFFIDEEEVNYIEKKDILKASFNIIDLIEEGDYVNGYKVSGLYNPTGEDIIHFTLITEKGYKTINPYVNFIEIKSIVTKEQFERMTYKVGE